MTTLSYTYNLTNGTTADANEVMGNFNSVAAVLNGNVDNANVNLAGSFNWTGVHRYDSFDLRLLAPSAGGIASLGYSDDAQNLSVTVPGNNNVAYTLTNTAHAIGLIHNFKLTLASGTLTLDGINNTWTSTRGGYVNQNFGSTNRIINFTAAQTFQDSSHGVDSDFVGTGTMSLGTTAAVAWGSAMPFLVGVCTDGTTPIVVMSRLPVATTGASNNIGYKDNAPSVASQKNVIAWTTTNVTVTHANAPITWIGSVRVVKTGADDWTFQTLDSSDGIGRFDNYGIRNFTFPSGQNGAASGKYFKDNGGTAPVFTNNNSIYTITMDGKITYKFRYEGDGGTDGATAVALQLATPFATADTGATDFFGRYTGFITWSAAANSQSCFPEFTPNSTTLLWFRNSSATARTQFNNNDFPNGGREVSGQIIYDGVRI